MGLDSTLEDYMLSKNSLNRGTTWYPRHFQPRGHRHVGQGRTARGWKIGWPRRSPRGSPAMSTNWMPPGARRGRTHLPGCRPRCSDRELAPNSANYTKNKFV